MCSRRGAGNRKGVARRRIKRERREKRRVTGRLIRGLDRGHARHNKCQTHSDYVMYDRRPGYRCAAAHRLITGLVARRNNAMEFNLAPINCPRYGKSDTDTVTWSEWNRMPRCPTCREFSCETWGVGNLQSLTDASKLLLPRNNAQLGQCRSLFLRTLFFPVIK